MIMQTTLILLKPDAVQRGLMGTLIDRFERKGLKIVAAKLVLVTDDLAKEHYAEHKEKKFFKELIGFITSSPVMAMAVAGPEAVTICRKLIGKTNGAEAEPGTIRGDFAVVGSKNLVHGSDSAESAERELALWFTHEEILNFERSMAGWIHG